MAEEIKSYRVYLDSTTSSCKYIVLLYNNQGQYFARLRFWDLQNVAAPTKSSGGIYLLNYRLDEYPHLIDLLRNEKPLYLWWYQTRASVATGPEPVGEEEGEQVGS